MTPAADLIALADTFRDTARWMRIYGCPAAAVQKVLDGAAECDAAAERLMDHRMECVA